MLSTIIIFVCFFVVISELNFSRNFFDRSMELGTSRKLNSKNWKKEKKIWNFIEDHAFQWMRPVGNASFIFRSVNLLIGECHFDDVLFKSKLSIIYCSVSVYPLEICDARKKLYFFEKKKKKKRNVQTQ